MKINFQARYSIFILLIFIISVASIVAQNELYLKFLQNKAEQGDGFAQFNLGKLYVQGQQRVIQDLIRAYFLLNKAIPALKGKQQEEALKTQVKRELTKILLKNNNKYL